MHNTRPTNFRTTIFCLLAVLAFSLAGPVSARSAGHVLILHSYHQGMPWTDHITEGLLTTFAGSDSPPEIHVEYMDSKRHPPEDIADSFEEILKSKYSDAELDVIIVSDNNGLEFLLERRDRLFPDVPIVFCGINNFNEAMLRGHTNITGVVEAIDAAGTIELARSIFPDLKRLVAITDTTPTGRANRRILEHASARLRGKLEIEIWDDLSADQLQHKLSALPKNTAVLLLTFHRDNAGQQFSITEYVDMVSQNCDRPIFSVWEHYLPLGVLGGKMVYGVSQGDKAAGMAMEILKGTPASDIPILTRSPNVPILNYIQLKRFNVPLDRIPGNCLILNEPHSFWRSHQKELAAGLAAMALMTCALVFMAVSICRRRQAERALREREQRLRFLFDRAADAIYVSRLDGQLIQVNEQACRETGYTSDELLSMNVADVDADKDNAQELDEFFQSLRPDETVTINSHHRRKDGQVYPVEITIANFEFSGERHILGIARDTTRRIEAEEALKISEERYHAMFEHMSSGVAVYEAVDEGDDFVFKAFNRAAEKIENMDRANLIGRKVTEIFPGVREFGIFKVFRRVWKTGEPEVHPVSMYKDDRIQGWRDNYVYRLPGGEIVAIYNDATEQKKTEEALMLSEERLNLAMDAVSDGVWDWRVDTGDVYFSPRWYTMLGYEPYELPQSFETWEKLLHPDDLERSKKAITSHLENGVPFQIEFRLRTKDGGTRWVLARGKMVEWNESGTARRMLGTHVDITERKLFEKELTEARDAAEEASKTKSEFLANMSHEVRTPLNGIMGMLQLLQTTHLNKEQFEYADNALLSSKRLTRLLSDILDLSRIEAGKLVIGEEPFDFHDAMASLKLLFSPAAEQKGLELEFNIAPDMPGHLIGDVVRLQQILSNLIGNAVKFTTKGRIGVSAAPLPSPLPDRRNILFTVSDTGEGIQDEQVDMLFEHFTQGSKGYARIHQGAGLGLAITKNLTGLMNGSISVESNPGHGTSFHISLPFRYASPAPAENRNPEHETIDTPLKILLAEDDAVTAFATSKLLEKLGHTIHGAKDGAQALRKLREEPCDLILMDIQMPVMDGMEVARAIRRGEAGTELADIPIIAMTAYAMAGDRETFLEAGMTDYIAKPVEVEALRQVLSVASRKAEQH